MLIGLYILGLSLKSNLGFGRWRYCLPPYPVEETRNHILPPISEGLPPGSLSRLMSLLLKRARVSRLKDHISTDSFSNILAHELTHMIHKRISGLNYRGSPFHDVDAAQVQAFLRRMPSTNLKRLITTHPLDPGWYNDKQNSFIQF